MLYGGRKILITAHFLTTIRWKVVARRKTKNRMHNQNRNTSNGRSPSVFRLSCRERFLLQPGPRLLVAKTNETTRFVPADA